MTNLSRMSMWVAVCCLVAPLAASPMRTGTQENPAPNTHQATDHSVAAAKTPTAASAPSADQKRRPADAKKPRRKKKSRPIAYGPDNALVRRVLQTRKLQAEAYAALHLTTKQKKAIDKVIDGEIYAWERTKGQYGARRTHPAYRDPNEKNKALPDYVGRATVRNRTEARMLQARINHWKNERRPSIDDHPYYLISKINEHLTEEQIATLRPILIRLGVMGPKTYISSPYSQFVRACGDPRISITDEHRQTILGWVKKKGSEVGPKKRNPKLLAEMLKELTERIVATLDAEQTAAFHDAIRETAYDDQLEAEAVRVYKNTERLPEVYKLLKRAETRESIEPPKTQAPAR